MAFKVPERYRVKQGAMASDAGYGNNGAFVVAAEYHGTQTRRQVATMIKRLAKAQEKRALKGKP